VRVLIERLERRHAPLDALLGAARELDLLYGPTRHPNGLASGTPGQALPRRSRRERSIWPLV